MKKKITNANEFALERLAAIKRVQDGETRYAVAKSIGVDQSTISDWIRMYEEEGVDRLNVPRKKIPRHHLDAEELRAVLLDCSDSKKNYYMSLLELANGEQLRVVAKSYGVSEQGLAQRRRLYLKNKSKLS